MRQTIDDIPLRQEMGRYPKLLEIVTDDPEKIKEAIRSASNADMIIISGGTSVGKRDYVPSVVESLGTLFSHGIGISPGKPTATWFCGYETCDLHAWVSCGRHGGALLFWPVRPFENLRIYPDEPDKVVHAGAV